MPPSRGLTVRVCIIYQLCLAKLPRANAVHTLKHPAKIGVVVKTDRPGHIIDRYMAHSQHRAGFTETQLVDPHSGRWCRIRSASGPGCGLTCPSRWKQTVNSGIHLKDGVQAATRATRRNQVYLSDTDGLISRTVCGGCTAFCTGKRREIDMNPFKRLTLMLLLGNC